jgi:hypothetical protein
VGAAASLGASATNATVGRFRRRFIERHISDELRPCTPGTIDDERVAELIQQPRCTVRPRAEGALEYSLTAVETGIPDSG